MEDVTKELKSLWQDYPGMLAGPAEAVPSEKQILPPTDPTPTERAAAAPAEAESWTVHPPQEVQPAEADDPTRDWYAGLRQDADEAEAQAAAKTDADRDRAEAAHRTELVHAVETDDYFAGMEAVRIPDQTWRRGDDDIIGLPEGSNGGAHSHHRWRPAFRLARR